MKVSVIGLACLFTGVLAVPVEQAQHAQQMQPQQMEPHQQAPAADTDMVLNGQASAVAGNVDIDAFQQMVSEVQAQVDAIEQMISQNAADPNALMESLIAPLTEVDSTLARGVSRLALPGIGGLGALLGGTVNVKKPAPLTLVGDLLQTVARLLENLLTRGPVGELLNGLLGGILGGVGGTVSGVLGGAGAGAGAGAAAQVPGRVDSILGSVGGVLPDAGGLVGGLPVALP